MVSLSDTRSSTSFNDPVFIRTHFLGRVASEDLGIAHQQSEWLKRQSSRHNDLCRWDANWFQPIVAVDGPDCMTSDTSDTEDDSPSFSRLSSSASGSRLGAHGRSRSNTLPLSAVASAPAELPRIRTLDRLHKASLLDDDSCKRDRAQSAPGARLLPPRPLTIDTAQPLRLSSTDLRALSDLPMLTIDTSSTTKTPVPAATSASPIRIECSESDGSCHGDAGDQDPEAQLAAGIIKLREQRKAAAKSQGRSISTKRRSADVASNANKEKSAKLTITTVTEDADDSDSAVILANRGSFVLRFAEAMLDFGSAALEKLSLSDGLDAFQESGNSLESVQPRRRSSTTPQQLAAEASQLRRRRQQTRSARVSRNSSEEALSTLSKLSRSWSVPKLLAFPPKFSPAVSMDAEPRSISSPVSPAAALP
ncbi:hypothetical protein BCV70DRAFT_81401 [Testicularia cyperi]|uniref:Uncharacterized protein n=1 Tax=Testicularia cyperi TaxID=1882483 RepID=A0A317XFD5_9BASI|nr:hypothetical protein BCV70DRAFT_81401 [Testicularia cyperi]